jgi:archaellum component FlaC
MNQKPSIYVQDVNESVLAATTSYYNTTITAVTDTNFSTLTMSIPSTDPAAKYMQAGNYLTFLYRGKAWRFQVVTPVYSDQGYFTVTANGLPLALINDQLDAVVAPSDLQGINYYLAEALQGTGWVVGSVAVSSKEKHKLSFEASNVITRLFNIADAFSCELDFSIELKGLIVSSKKVNVVTQIGSERSDILLGWGDNVTDISKTVDISSMVTALKLTGANGLTLKSTNYASDDKRYKSPIDDDVLYDTVANKQYNLGANYLVGTYADDTAKDAAHLITSGIAQLETLSKPTTTIETSLASVPDSLELGDTINVISNDPNSAEYLKTRVVELDMCLDDPSKSTAKFGDYKSLTDDDLSALIQLKKQVANVTEIANTATAGVEEAKQVASDASSAASAAQDTANTANSAATQAQKDAQTASDTASKAMTAVTGVQDSVNTAKADATQAASDAASAKLAAEDASKLANANATAISTANEALTAAQTDIADAKKDASDALTQAGTVSGSVTTLSQKVDDQAGTISTLAKQSDVDTLTKSVNTQETAIEQNTNDIKLAAKQADVDTLSQTLTTQATSIEENAKAIALKANQSDLDKATGDISAAQTAITANAKAIALKADQTAVDSATDRLTTAEANIKATADGVTTTATKAVTDAMAKLTIGARNLLLNSSNFNNDAWSFTGIDTTANGQNDAGNTYTVSTAVGAGPMYAQNDLVARGLMAVGGSFTLSASIRNTSTTTPVDIAFYATNGTTPIATQGQKVATIPADNAWHKVSITFTTSAIVDGATLGFTPSVAMTDGQINQAELKLEKGNVSTDWTPAPEDIANRMATAEQELTSDAITNTVMNSQDFATWQSSVDAKPDQADLDAVNDAMDSLGDQVQTNVSQINTVKQTAAGTKNTVDTLVTSVAGNTKVTQDIQNYMDFSSDGLTLGKSDSDMQVNITNDQLSFLSNGGTVAYINGQRLYITDAQVLNSIIVGHHKITKYSDDGETTVVTFAG